jgi:molybdopterin adenylyltransferase
VKIAVITVSDRASAGLYEDLSGPAMVAAIRESWPESAIETEIVPDGIDAVKAALARHAEADWILTTGGTGPSPRDMTPEATTAYCDRLVPGIAEYCRARSLEETPNAVFSRGAAGMKGTQYIVNCPGSVKAAVFHARLLAPLFGHGIDMAAGRGH